MGEQITRFPRAYGELPQAAAFRDLTLYDPPTGVSPFPLHLSIKEGRNGSQSETLHSHFNAERPHVLWGRGKGVVSHPHSPIKNTESYN